MEIWKRNLAVCCFGSFVTVAAMSQIAPILPLYIEHLGIHEVDAVERWSGLIFGATFLVSAIAAPLWGNLADKYGRKPMLLRASMGMAIAAILMAFAQNVYQLLGIRLLMGAVSGFISPAITLVSIQAPQERSGWALGTLTAGSVGGTLLGPIFGGYLADLWGFRNAFFAMGFLLSLAFLATWLFVQDAAQQATKEVPKMRHFWKRIPHQHVLLALCFSSLIVSLANMSIQPIITLYVRQLNPEVTHLSLFSGTVVAASGLATILASSRLGKLSDRIGAKKVLVVSLVSAGLLFIPQAFVQETWQLILLRFLLGIATAGMLPSINSLIHENTPVEMTGQIFGYNQSARSIGILVGSVIGGQIAALFDIHYVFLITGALLLLNSLWIYYSFFSTHSLKKCP